MVFLTVNLFENLHAYTYGIYNYIYKVRKNATASARPPAAARRGRPNWQLRALEFSIEGRKEEESCHDIYLVLDSMMRAVEAATRVGRTAIIQGCHPWHFF